MGLNITKNKSGKYKLVSSFTDKKLHKELWISEDEAKRILINRRLWEFIEGVIEVDLSFPSHVDGKVNFEGKDKFFEWTREANKSEDIDKMYQDKFMEIYNRLKLTFKLP